VSGADSFDGLEWCQTVVDHATGQLHHFQLWDFFADQTAIGTVEDVPYAQRVLAHNLAFYARWLERIRRALIEGRALDLLAQYLPEVGIKRMRAKFAERI
jgi:hypothetical protein